MTWFVGVKDRSRWSAKCWKYDPVRTIIRDVGDCHHGLQRLVLVVRARYLSANFVHDVCFLFGKVDLYGWFRSARKVLSMIAFVFQTIQTAGDVLQLLNHWRTSKLRNPRYFPELAERLLGESEARRRPAADEQAPSLKGKVVYQGSACFPMIGLD